MTYGGSSAQDDFAVSFSAPWTWPFSTPAEALQCRPRGLASALTIWIGYLIDYVWWFRLLTESNLEQLTLVNSGGDFFFRFVTHNNLKEL